MPCRSKKFHKVLTLTLTPRSHSLARISSSVRSGCTSVSPSNQSQCAARIGWRCPPTRLAAKELSRRQRCTHSEYRQLGVSQARVYVRRKKEDRAEAAPSFTTS